jgi:signal transduction histidine kinase
MPVRPASVTGQTMFGTRIPRSALPLHRLVGEAAAFVGAYLLLDWVSYIHPWEELGITVWNPPAALTLALLLRRGPAWAPVVFAAALTAEFLIHIADSPAWVNVLSAGVLTLGYAGIAGLLRRNIRIDLGLPSWRDLLRLVIIVQAGVLGIGAVYVAVPVSAGLIQPDAFGEALARFWIGEVIGILATLPLLLILTDSQSRAALLRRVATPEVALQFAALSLTLGFVFAWSGGAELKWFYVLFLPVVWISMRHGLLVTALAVQWVEAGLIIAIYRLHYPAGLVEDLQSLMLCLTLMGLILGVTVDERARALNELKRSIRLAAAGEMTATVVHELNQPLTALSNYGEISALLVKNGAPPAELEPVVHSIVSEVARVGRVLGRLRDFLRSGTTRLEDSNLRDLLASAIADVQERADRQQTTLSLQLSGEPSNVRVDRIEIGIVLRNLLANALDSLAAIPGPGRSITVSADAFGQDQVCVSVTDSGSGVEADFADRVFDPFVTSKAQGMGLGLTISRSIVETHGGRLWFERRNGTAFCFTLPVSGGAA